MQQLCDIRYCQAYASFYWELGDGARAYRCEAHEYELVPQGATRHEYHLAPGNEGVTANEYRIVREPGA